METIRIKKYTGTDRGVTSDGNIVKGVHPGEQNGIVDRYGNFYGKIPVTQSVILGKTKKKYPIPCIFSVGEQIQLVTLIYVPYWKVQTVGGPTYAGASLDFGRCFLTTYADFLAMEERWDDGDISIEYSSDSSDPPEDEYFFANPLPGYEHTQTGLLYDKTAILVLFSGIPLMPDDPLFCYMDWGYWDEEHTEWFPVQHDPLYKEFDFLFSSHYVLFNVAADYTGHSTLHHDGNIITGYTARKKSGVIQEELFCYADFNFLADYLEDIEDSLDLDDSTGSYQTFIQAPDYSYLFPVEDIVEGVTWEDYPILSSDMNDYGSWSGSTRGYIALPFNVIARDTWAGTDEQPIILIYDSVIEKTIERSSGDTINITTVVDPGQSMEFTITIRNDGFPFILITGNGLTGDSEFTYDDIPSTITLYQSEVDSFGVYLPLDNAGVFTTLVTIYITRTDINGDETITTFTCTFNVTIEAV